MIDFEKQQIDKVFSERTAKFNELIIEGLKRKGFEFENRLELETFIKSNCRAEEFPQAKERKFYVNDTPFLLFKWNDFNMKQEVKRGLVSFVSELGSYTFL